MSRSLFNDFVMLFVLSWIFLNLLVVPVAYAYHPDNSIKTESISENFVQNKVFGKITPIEYEQAYKRFYAQDPLDPLKGLGVSALSEFSVIILISLFIFIIVLFFRKRSEETNILAEKVIVFSLVSFSVFVIGSHMINAWSSDLINDNFYNQVGGGGVGGSTPATLMTLIQSAGIPTMLDNNESDCTKMYFNADYNGSIHEFFYIFHTERPGLILYGGDSLTTLDYDKNFIYSYHNGTNNWEDITLLSPATRISFIPDTGDRFLEDLSIEEGIYGGVVIGFNDAETEIVYFCENDSLFEIKFEGDDFSQNFCVGSDSAAVMTGPNSNAGKFTRTTVWDDASDQCCGDDIDDNPDDHQSWCENCSLIGTYYEAQDPGRRDWMNGLGCCGDDLGLNGASNQGDTPDCIKGQDNNLLCVSRGGMLDADRYLTLHMTTPKLAKTPKNDDSFSNALAVNYCTSNENEGTVYEDRFGTGYGSTSGYMRMEKMCQSTIGEKINIVGGAKQDYNATLIHEKPPYFVKNANWLYAEANSNTRGKIIYVSCAGYPIISDGSNFISCNNYLANPDIEDGFENVTSDALYNVPNPYGINGNSNILCHSSPDYIGPGPYMISECCEPGNCKTCVFEGSDSSALEDPCSGGTEPHHKSPGDKIVFVYNNTNHTAIERTEPVLCNCYKYNPLTDSEECYLVPTSEGINSLPNCGSSSSDSFCVCSYNKSFTQKFYCINEEETGWMWRTKEYVSSLLYNRTGRPITKVHFASCIDGGSFYTPINLDLDPNEGVSYYCSENEWVTDLDDSYHEDACDQKYTWTGTRCCGELDDFPEFYNDTDGACWRSEPQELNEFINDTYHGNSYEYTEMIVMNDGIHGCAIDDQNSSISLILEDQSRGVLSNYSYKLENAPFKEYGGSRSGNIEDRNYFGRYKYLHSWTYNSTNDWILDIKDPYGQQLVINEPYCKVLDVDGTNYTCGFNETWYQGNYSHLSFVEWGIEVEGAQAAGCCKPDQCWNLTECINGSISTLEPVYPKNNPYWPKFKCVEGNWTEAFKKFTWDKLNYSYSVNKSWCLVDPKGNESNNFDPDKYDYLTYMQDGSQNPQFIRHGQFIMDHFCYNGTWKTRTQVIAAKLKEFGESQGSYSLYCDSYDRTLNKADYNLSVYNTATCPITGFYLPVMDLYINENGYGTLSCPSDCQGNESCVNSFCVLTWGSGSNEKVAFGVALNKPYDHEEFPFSDVLVPGGGSILVNENLSSVIYSKDIISIPDWDPYNEGILGSLMDAIMDLLKGIFGFFVDNPVGGLGIDYSYITQTKDFDQYYVAMKNQRQVEAIIEDEIRDIYNPGLPPQTYVYIRYDGFQVNICDSFEPEIALYYNSVQCIENGSSYTLESMDTSFFTPEVWQKVAPTLRLDDDTFGYGITSQSGSLPICSCTEGDTSCDGCVGTNKIIFPVNNSAGRYVTYPIKCVGDYSINTTYTDWELGCGEGGGGEFLSTFTCIKPDGSYFENCPQLPPEEGLNKTEWSCFNDQCSGYNSRINYMQNDIGQSNNTGICCDHAWMIDVSENNWDYKCCSQGILWDEDSPGCNEENWYICDEQELPEIVEVCGNHTTNMNIDLNKTGVECVCEPGWTDEPIMEGSSYVIGGGYCKEYDCNGAGLTCGGHYLVPDDPTSEWCPSTWKVWGDGTTNGSNCSTGTLYQTNWGSGGMTAFYCLSSSPAEFNNSCMFELGGRNNCTNETDDCSIIRYTGSNGAFTTADCVDYIYGCGQYANSIIIGDDSEGRLDIGQLFDTNGQVLDDFDGDGESYLTDCNDADPSINHYASEICGNGVDEDCDGEIDDMFECHTEDFDGDGYDNVDDCEPSDPDVNPGANENDAITCRDGVDNDCDGDIDYYDSGCPALLFGPGAPYVNPNLGDPCTVELYKEACYGLASTVNNAILDAQNNLLCQSFGNINCHDLNCTNNQSIIDNCIHLNTGEYLVRCDMGGGSGVEQADGRCTAVINPGTEDETNAGLECDSDWDNCIGVGMSSGQALSNAAINPLCNITGTVDTTNRTQSGSAGSGTAIVSVRGYAIHSDSEVFRLEQGLCLNTDWNFDNDGDGYIAGIDCDDNNRYINPGISESDAYSCGVCHDGIDNDCDGWADCADEECCNPEVLAYDWPNGGHWTIPSEKCWPVSAFNLPYNTETAIVRAKGFTELWVCGQKVADASDYDYLQDSSCSGYTYAHTYNTIAQYDSNCCQVVAYNDVKGTQDVWSIRTQNYCASGGGICANVYGYVSEDDSYCSSGIETGTEFSPISFPANVHSNCACGDRTCVANVEDGLYYGRDLFYCDQDCPPAIRTFQPQSTWSAQYLDRSHVTYVSIDVDIIGASRFSWCGQTYYCNSNGVCSGVFQQNAYGENKVGECSLIVTGNGGTTSTTGWSRCYCDTNEESKSNCYWYGLAMDGYSRPSYTSPNDLEDCLHCGDGICNYVTYYNERYSTSDYCSTDCCGDGYCRGPEADYDSYYCTTDCRYNGVCDDPEESGTNYHSDCCGDGNCYSPESMSSCCEDCGCNTGYHCDGGSCVADAAP